MTMAHKKTLPAEADAAAHSTFWHWLWRWVQPAYLTMRALGCPTTVGVTALVECAGKIVLVRHSYLPGWHLPGGGVDRGETPAAAILREMREEIGLTHSAPPQLVGVLTRCSGPTTNHVLLYRLADAEFHFHPNLEIRECQLIDPAMPPEGTSAATRRRLTEYLTQMSPAARW